MKTVGLVLAASAALLAASPAFAQSETKGNFTGFRIGGLIGTTGTSDFGGFNNGSFTYGANAGYDYETHGAVIGITGEWSDVHNHSFGRDLSATVRAGGKIGSRGLLYALGGYTNASLNTKAFLGHNLHADGFRLGAGGEIAVTRNLYVNAEERYSDYGRPFGIRAHSWQTVGSVGVRF
ncbi:MAG TPA: outer membrane beta-barrel protein [Allosphingosinicella sp.]|jgi:outer membrane immunogenic protein